MSWKEYNVAKYDPLAEHLRRLNRDDEHTLTFGEIERILGFELPKSARTHQAWWANEKDGRHVQANAWLDAGCHTKDLNLKTGKVTFRPVHLPRAPKGRPKYQDIVRPLTIAQAKEAVALHFGIRPTDVMITVRA